MLARLLVAEALCASLQRSLEAEETAGTTAIVKALAALVLLYSRGATASMGAPFGGFTGVAVYSSARKVAEDWTPEVTTWKPATTTSHA